MMKYKSLFIDLDDTLWDTFHNNKACLEELYDDFDMGRYYSSFEAFFAVYFPHNTDLWAQYRRNEIDKRTLMIGRFLHVFKPLGVEDPQELLRINDLFLQKTTMQTRLVEGAIELLTYLKSRYRLFILSNGFREVQYLKLKNSGLAPFFERMVLSEDADVQKPQRGIFDYALINTNSRRAESLMIGDSWDADMQGACNAKMDAIWFNPQGESPTSSSFQPLYTVKTLLEIKDIL